MYIHRQAEEIMQKKLKNNKILLILGARQVGKTTLVKHVLEGKKTLFLNLDITVDKDKFKNSVFLPSKTCFTRVVLEGKKTLFLNLDITVDKDKFKNSVFL